MLCTATSVVAVFVGLFLSGCSEAAPPRRTLRVGFQKWGTCSILKASGRLEDKLKANGWAVEWFEFPAGPPLLEALNVGSIDVGHTGDSPPVFAQAAGVPFVYIAASSPSPQSSGLLVRAGDSIQSVVDLRGKRIGFTKGTSAHTLVVRILEQHKIDLQDVDVKYLTPADGRAALASGAIDAWSIWDPYMSSAEHAGDVRRIADGQGIVSGREFYLSSRVFATQNSQILRLFLQELCGAKQWAIDRPDEIHALLAEQTGMPLDAVKLAESRRNRYDTWPITDELIAEQQALADRYYELGLLTQGIRVEMHVDRAFGEFLK